MTDVSTPFARSIYMPPHHADSFLVAVCTTRRWRWLPGRRRRGLSRWRRKQRLPGRRRRRGQILSALSPKTEGLDNYYSSSFRCSRRLLNCTLAILPSYHIQCSSVRSLSAALDFLLFLSEKHRNIIISISNKTLLNDDFQVLHCPVERETLLTWSGIQDLWTSQKRTVKNN